MSNKNNIIEIGTIKKFSYNDKITKLSDDYRVFYLKNGKSKVSIDNRDFTMETEDIVLVNQNESIVLKLSRDVELIVIHLPQSNVLRYSNYKSVKFNCNSSVQDSVKFNEIRKIINRSQRLSLDKESNLVLNSQLLILLNELLVNFAEEINTKDSEKEKFEKHFRRNLRIKEFIEENYNHDISLSDLADELDLSLSYTSRFFNDQFGISFTDYVNGLRILNASEDLIFTDLTIIKVAMINGFTNVSRFNSVFKEKYGVTPSVYRETKRNEVINSGSKSDFIEYNNLHQKKLDDNFKKYISKDVVNTKHFDVDVNNVEDKLNFGFNKIINIGLSTKLKEDELLFENLVKNSLYGFKYIRIVLDLEKLLNTQKENFFEFVNRIHEHQLVPYLKLKQSELSYKNLSELLSESVNRLGISLVRLWKIEIEYEEDSKNDIKDILVSFLNVLNLENIGVWLGGNVDEFELNTKLSKLDGLMFGFVSFSYYILDHKDNHKNSEQSANYIYNVNKTIKSKFNNSSVIMSEWGFSKDDSIIYDSLYFGSFIVDFLLKIDPFIDLVGYANINDAYTNTPNFNVLHGGKGLATPSHIEKPSGHSYIFLRKLGRDILFKNENIIVSKRNDFEYLIVGHNTHNLNDYFYRNKDRISNEDGDLIFDSETVLKADINMMNLPLGKYRLKTYKMNKYNGDVLELWNELGNVLRLQTDELNYLKSRSVPKLKLKIVDNTNILTIPVQLDKNEFFMTYIYRIL